MMADMDQYSAATAHSPELSRYQDQLEAARQAQMGAAEYQYGGATAPSTIGAQAARGDIYRQQIGGLGQGGLEAVRAMQGAGAGAMGAGIEASRRGLESRQQATQAIMAAQSRQGDIEHAMMQAEMQRVAATEEAYRRKQAAEQMVQDAKNQAAMQMVGAATGAGGAAISAARNHGGGGEGGDGGGGGQW